MARPAPTHAQEFVDHGTERLGLHVYPEPGYPEPGYPEFADGDAPIVVVFPAMGTPARYYAPLAGSLRAAGLAVIVADLRGTGASTPRPSRSSRYGYAEIAADVDAVLAELKPRLRDRPVLLLGHSLGGQAAALHIARSGGEGVAGLVLVGVGLPWYRSYPGRRKLGVLVFTQAILAIATVVGVWPGWGFGGRQARGVIRDWGYTARRGRFPSLGGIDPASDLATVRTPVLAVSVEHDRYTPAPTVDHFVSLLPGAKIERRHLTSGSTGTPLDHFRWVRAADPLATWVADFAADARAGRRDRPG